jgi:hypothetical protein
MPDTSRNHRNQRNNRYSVLDDFAARQRYTTAGIAWRWRTEVATLILITAAVWRLSLLITLTWAAVVVGLALILLAFLPWIRKRAWCVLTRHRIQRLCWEARLHTRSGRLPVILWTRPTKVGVRLHLWCRAGICAEDFDAHRGELRAACYAREARVTRNTTWSHLVTIDIIRHDTLAAGNTIPSPLRGHHQRPERRDGIPEPASTGRP